MSTSSKLIVDALRHEGRVRSSIPPHDQLLYLNEAPRDAQAHMLATYDRVVFIRNPYSRLYSAWTNKFRDMPDTCTTRMEGGVPVLKCNIFYDNWVHIGSRVLRHAGLAVPEEGQEVLRAVTWPLFLNAVLAGVAKDRHWINQV